MPDISGSKLATLTGKSWRTVKARLEAAGVRSHRRQGNADLYDSALALDAIYSPEATNADDLDAIQQRARKDKESADKLAMENAETRGDIARISVMEAELAMLFSELRTNALAIPAKLAPGLAGKSAEVIQRAVESAIYDLLTDLANYEPGQRRKADA